MTVLIQLEFDSKYIGNQEEKISPLSSFGLLTHLCSCHCHTLVTHTVAFITAKELNLHHKSPKFHSSRPYSILRLIAFDLLQCHCAENNHRGPLHGRGTQAACKLCEKNTLYQFFTLPSLLQNSSCIIINTLRVLYQNLQQFSMYYT